MALLKKMESEGLVQHPNFYAEKDKIVWITGPKTFSSLDLTNQDIEEFGLLLPEEVDDSSLILVQVIADFVNQKYLANWYNSLSGSTFLVYSETSVPNPIMYKASHFAKNLHKIHRLEVLSDLRSGIAFGNKKTVFGDRGFLMSFVVEEGVHLKHCFDIPLEFGVRILQLRILYENLEQKKVEFLIASEQNIASFTLDVDSLHFDFDKKYVVEAVGDIVDFSIFDGVCYVITNHRKDGILKV